MFGTVFGLPTHALVVHAVVVLLPLAAAAAVVVALVPAARRRYGVVVALLTVAAVGAVPVATRSGERLFARKSATFGPSDTVEAGLMERHRELGGQVLPWALLLLAGVLVVVALPLLTAGRRAAVRVPEPMSVPAAGPSEESARGGSGHEGAAPGGTPARHADRHAARHAERHPVWAPPWTRWVGWAGIAAVLVGAVMSAALTIRAGHAGSEAVWDRLDRPGTSTGG